MADQFQPIDDQSGDPPPLTPEQLASLPHDDAGPKIVAALWTLTCVAALFLALRLYCKIQAKRGFWWDDYILAASWICLLVNCCCWTVAVVKYNFGVHSWDMPPQNLVPLGPTMMTGGSFILIAVIWSKTSFGVTLLRLTTGWMTVSVWLCILATNISLGLSVLFNIVSCTPVQRSWNPTIPGTCWSPDKLINYHIFSGAVSAFVDVALSLLPTALLWDLQMRKREKVGIVIAMSMGIFAGITSIIKTAMLPTLAKTDIQSFKVIVYWAAAEAATTIVAASIPVLRMFAAILKSSRNGNYDAMDQPTPYGSASGNVIFATTATAADKRKASMADANPIEPSILDKSLNGLESVAMEVLVAREDGKAGGNSAGCQRDHV